MTTPAIVITNVDAQGVAATLSAELAARAHGERLSLRLEVDGRAASEAWPETADQRRLTFPIPANRYDGQRHDCAVFPGDGEKALAAAALTFPLRKRTAADRMSCRLVNAVLLVDVPPGVRSCVFHVALGAQSVTRRVTRPWHAWRQPVALLDVRDQAAPHRPLSIVVRSGEGGGVLDGGAMTVGTQNRPLAFGGIDAVDGPFVSGFFARLPGGGRAAQDIRLVQGKTVLAHARADHFRPDVLEKWHAPWSGFTAALPVSTGPGKISLSVDGVVYGARTFTKIDRELSRWCEIFVFGRARLEVRGILSEAERFMRRMDKKQKRLHKKSRSLHEILKGILTVLVALGRHDDAARLLAREQVWPFLGCGDGRVLEGMRALIDQASPPVLARLLAASGDADDVMARLLAPRLRLRLASGADSQARAILEDVLQDAAMDMHLRLFAGETLAQYGS